MDDDRGELFQSLDDEYCNRRRRFAVVVDNLFKCAYDEMSAIW